MILTVSGWRDWNLGPAVIHEHLERYRAKYGASLHVRVGDADGVDKHIRDWLFAAEQGGSGISYYVYVANWGVPRDRAAGPIRNARMLQGLNEDDLMHGHLAHELLAFPQPGINWRQPGSGTVDCILQAVKLGVTLHVPGFVRPRLSGRQEPRLWD